MSLLFLLACGVTAPPAPTVEPEPTEVPEATIGTVKPKPAPPAPVAPNPDGTPGEPVVVDATTGEPTLVNPAAGIDQSWLQQPTSHVTAPEWPLTLVEPAMCGTVGDGGPVSADGCITDELRCGDNLIGHTVGGINRYDTEFYEKKFCWPATVRHDEGNERVYKLKVPAGEWRAWVTLYSPCSDLNVSAVRFDRDTCPTMGNEVKVCEMSVKKGQIADRIELTSQTPEFSEPTYYVIVEGLEKNDGLFSLHVQCSPGLGGPIPRDKLIGGVEK